MIAPIANHPNIDTSRPDPDDRPAKKPKASLSADAVADTPQRRPTLYQEGKPLPEPIIDESDFWKLRSAPREVYHVDSPGVEVFHFLQRCPAFASATHDHYVESVRGRLKIEQVQERLSLRVCRTCMRLSGASESRAAEAWAEYETARAAQQERTETSRPARKAEPDPGPSSPPAKPTKPKSSARKPAPRAKEVPAVWAENDVMRLEIYADHLIVLVKATDSEKAQRYVVSAATVTRVRKTGSVRRGVLPGIRFEDSQYVFAMELSTVADRDLVYNGVLVLTGRKPSP